MNEKRSHMPSPLDWAQPKGPASASPPGRLRALPPNGLALQVVPLEHGRGLRLAGELCLATAAGLSAVLDTLPEDADVLDVANLSFMDSSGLHAFERYARRLVPRPLVILNPPAQIQRLFELTGAYLNPDIELRTDADHG